MEAKVSNGSQNPPEPPVQPRTVKLNGVLWPWMVSQEALDALKAYDVWEDDIWVTTYPKAGTHWALEIVNLILVDGHEDKIDRAQKSYPVEFDLSQPGGGLTNLIPSSVQYRAMKKWKAPRVIMTHLTEELMPTQIYKGTGKVLYIIRNPKDTAVSNWHFVRPMEFDPRYDDWNYFVRASFTEDMIFGSWFTHVLNFWKKHRYDKNFLFIHYEDMKRDTKGVVIQIADFIGKHLSEDAVDRIVEFSSMRSMAARSRNQGKRKDVLTSSCNHEEVSMQGEKEPAKKTGIGAVSVFRKGIVGDWKSTFTVAQNEAFDTLYEEKMAGSGLTVQFE